MHRTDREVSLWLGEEFVPEKAAEKFSTELDALATDWFNAYGGWLSRGQLGYWMKPLLVAHPFSQVQIHWQRYIAEHRHGRSVFASPAQFAARFMEFAPPSHSPIVTLHTPVSKTVVETVGQRTRLIQVDINDPRPAA